MNRPRCLRVVFFSIVIGLQLCLGNNTPTQIHIAIAGKTSQGVAISWITPQWTRSFVQLTSSHNTSHPPVVVESSDHNASRYTFNTYHSGYIHHVVIARDQLEPNTTYLYTCGDLTFMSAPLSFKSMPKVGSASVLTFGIVGDVGQTKYSRETLNYLTQDLSLDVILHAGDLSYADRDQSRWDSWGQLIQPLASRIPWMVGPGNHEIEPCLGVAPFTAYQARFRMPYRESHARQGNLYHSFDVGKVHFIFLTPYASFTSASRQSRWLVADLNALVRDVTPWIVVVMHAPWYNSNTAHQSLLEPQYLMKYEMEQVLYDHRVDLVLSGHVHAYERSFPVYHNLRTDDGPTYVTIGDAGNREGIASEFIHPSPEWSAFRRGRYGYGRFIVTNTSHALFEWHEDTVGQVTVPDATWIVRTDAMRQRTMPSSASSRPSPLVPSADVSARVVYKASTSTKGLGAVTAVV